MSKLSQALLIDSVTNLINDSTIKQRKFTETIELQIGLKNYSTVTERRFNGAISLKHIPRPNLKVCIIGEALHCEEAQENQFSSCSIDDLKKFNKNKKEIKRFFKQYDLLFASDTILRIIPRTLGPVCSKLKFPTKITHEDNLVTKVEEGKSIIKFQLRKTLGLGVAVGNVKMTVDQVVQNILLAVNFLVSLLKKKWQNVKSVYIKSSMGKPYKIY